MPVKSQSDWTTNAQYLTVSKSGDWRMEAQCLDVSELQCPAGKLHLMTTRFVTVNHLNIVTLFPFLTENGPALYCSKFIARVGCIGDFLNVLLLQRNWLFVCLFLEIYSVFCSTLACRLWATFSSLNQTPHEADYPWECYLKSWNENLL